MLEFRSDNIFVQFAKIVYQQTVGIPAGKNCAPLLADLFLFLYEAEFIQQLLKEGKKNVARNFNFTCRYKDKDFAMTDYMNISNKTGDEAGSAVFQCFTCDNYEDISCLEESTDYIKMINFMKGVRERIRRGSLPDLLDEFTKLKLTSPNKRSNSVDLQQIPVIVKSPKVKTLKKPKPDAVSEILLDVLDTLNRKDEEDRKIVKAKIKERKEKHRRLRRKRLVNYSDTSSDEEETLPEVSSLEVYKELLQLRFLQIRSRMTREQTFSPEMKHEISHMNGMKSMVDRLKHVTMSDLVLPDYTGYLTDQSDSSKNYCVIADMLFCMFENEMSEHPKEVMLLPGCCIRSLVYQTPETTNSNSKTISGLDRYQIIIDDSGARRKYLFSVESDTELLEWMSALKSASNLDQELSEDTPTPSVEPRRHSICIDPSVQRHGTQGSHISPRYVPSARSSSRTILQAFSANENNTSPEPENDRASPASPTKDAMIDDFRRRLRRDAEPEATKPTPVKATYFTGSQTPQKKISAFKRFRSFGSLESLFKPKRRNSKSGDSTDSMSVESAEIPSPRSSSRKGSFDGSSAKVKLKGSKRLSRSLEFGKHEPGQNNGLVRRASDLKDKFVKAGKSEHHSVRLEQLSDAKLSGYLQHKALIKWQKLWCVVCRGCFYGFKSNSPGENSQVALNLTNCTVVYVSDRDKRYKKMFAFKLSQQGKKSHYFNASDTIDLSKWIQILQMEASKVQIDAEFCQSSQCSSDSFQSNLSTSSVSSQSNEKPVPKPRRTKTMQSDRDLPSTDKTTPNPEVHRRSSMPSSIKVNETGNDVEESSSTDDWQTTGSDNVRVNERFGVPGEDTPEHDQALKEVWQKDRNYLFNVVRAKLRSYKERRENIYNTDLPGPNNEGLLMVADDRAIKLSSGKLKGNSRDVRRSQSFNVKPTSMAEGSPQTPPHSPTPMKKKHKALSVKKLAARDIENPAISSYLERRGFTGNWIRYWYVLKDGTLFCYLTPDDNITADILNLSGYKVSSLVDKFRGKRFVLQLKHMEYTSTFLSVESREEMNDWMETLDAATKEAPCANGIADEDVFSDIPVEQYQDKCNSVKQKLLAEMLRQKHELERKQASRQKNKLQQPDGERLMQTWSPESDEKLISDVTKLRQRRMSAQIKVDVIQKQMQQPQQSSNKKFFSFGGKKKQPSGKNEYLEGQLRELTDKLQKIDQDLSSHNYIQKSEVIDKSVNSNRKLVAKNSNEPEVKNSSETLNGDTRKESDSNKNSSNLKSSVQKLAHKTFSKSLKTKLKKENGSVPIINGHLESPTSESRGFYGDDLVDGGQENDYVGDKYRSDSFTDLTSKDRMNNNDLKLDLSFNDQYEESGPKRMARKTDSNSSTSLTSPRREIDPSVMAEIDAFEEFTRQALSAKSTTS